MGYILKNTSGLINTRITDTGRLKISQGNFNIAYFQIGDSEVSYNAVPQSTYNQFNSFVLEPSFNAQNSSGVPQSNKENVKYPYYVDGSAGNTYGIPFMASIVEPVYNRAAPRGFFTGSTVNGVFDWSAVTNNTHVINSNYIVAMSALTGTNTIDVIYNECNDSAVRPIQKGDFLTIFYDGNGLVDCLCTTGTTTTTSTSTTTTTTNPCVTPLPTTTTTTTTCSFINPCCPSAPVNCSVDLSSCYSMLTYRVTDVCDTTVVLDRLTPDFSNFSSTCYGRIIVYPSGMTEIYDSVTPSNHWGNDVINFESICYTDEFDVKIWNMNIPWSESPAGIDPNVYKDYTSFGSINYLGSKEYFGYASSSGQTDTSSVYYYNSFDEQVVVTPEEQKAIAIVHYTNQTVDLFYGEKFALEPYDETAEDTTGQARNFKIDLPWLMWHKNPNCCYGQSFYVDPPNFDNLNLFTVHYLESNKNSDMNDPGIRYYHLWDTNANTDGYPSRVGKVFPDSKIIIFDDEEIVASMSYKSNRNWTLPAPKVSLITPNICGVDNNSVEGILTGNTDYLYVTYRLSNTSVFTNSLHCNYYQLIQGPNVSCNPISSQNVSVRFGNEFSCLSTSAPSITPCWYSGFTLWFQLAPEIFGSYSFVDTNQDLNGFPIFRSLTPGGVIYNIFWNNTNWILRSNGNTNDVIINFTNNELISNYTFTSGEISVSGYTECSYNPSLCVSICEENTSCLLDNYYSVLSGTTELYLPQGFNLTERMVYNSPDWELYSADTKIATLTGLTQNDLPIGSWTPDISSITGVTTSLIEDCYTIVCESYTAETTTTESIIRVVDCSYVISDDLTGTTFSGCALTFDGSFDISITNVSGSTNVGVGTGGCIDPVTTTTTTICPPTCDIFQGFYADKFEILCQKVSVTGTPDPSEWRIIDFTSQISANTINGFITQSGLTGNTFVITQNDYDNATIYDLNDYINLTPVGFTGHQLNFGDEFYFYGNVETDIQATIYEMIYKINLGQAEFQSPSNPTWSSTNNRYVTEIGLYNENKELMIISKMQSPVLRQGIQQFLIKLDI